MRAELIAIGSELTGGHTINTNASHLACELAGLGIPCVRHVAIGDEKALIVQTIRRAAAEADLVITTGGLGPTFDDITVEAVAEAVGRPLRPVPAIATRIRAFYRRYGRRLDRAALRQALVPDGADALPNPIGTAPGIWIAHHGVVIVVLPGVPLEMRALMAHSVLPRLRRLAGRSAVISRTIRTIGVVELEIEAIMRRLRIPAGIQGGLYPQIGMVDARFTATGLPAQAARRALDRLDRALAEALGPSVYGHDEETLEGAAGDALAARRWTLAVAESCTGGLIADRLTNVPGSSRYFVLGEVVYQNRMKERLLGVDRALLARYGAVSPEVARAMADGVRRRAGADLGLSVTGIAGPAGGTPRKPVGLVYLALAAGGRIGVRRLQLHGDRFMIKQRTAQIALDWIRRFARRLPGGDLD